MRRTRSAAGVAAALLATTALSGCGLLGLGDSGGLEKALDSLPGDTTSLQYVDLAKVREAAGAEAPETGEATDDEVGDYATALIDRPTSTLTTYLVQMQDAAFSDFDVEWEATVSDGPILTVWQLRDSVDLEDVADDMESAGYTRDDDGDGIRLTAPSLDEAAESAYPVPLLNLVTLLPDDHLVVSTGDEDALDDAVATIGGDDDSLADADTFDVLIDAAGGADTVAFALMGAGDEACAPSARPTSPAPDQGTDALGTPETKGTFLVGDDADDPQVVLGFDDDSAAEDDADARKDFLEDAVSVATGQPYSDLATWEITTDGSAEIIDADYDLPSQAITAASQGDDLGRCG